MKALFIPLIFLLQVALVYPQSAKLSIEDNRSKNPNITLFVNGMTQIYEPSRMYNEEGKLVLIDGKLTREWPIDKITSVILFGEGWLKRMYISPGDDLKLTISTLENKDSVKITGIGAENNQYLAFEYYLNSEKFKNDTLPDHVIQELKRLEDFNRQALDDYKKQHKTTPEFNKMMEGNLQYFTANQYHNFYGNQNFTLRKMSNYDELHRLWEAQLDNIFSKIKLNNEQVLQSSLYTDLLGDYLLRKKEKIWNTINDSTVLKKYYPELPKEEAMRLFGSDQENLLVERIINTEFTGKVNEYAYAILLRNIKEDKKTSAVEIIDRFEKKFPQSPYLSMFSKTIAEIKENDSRKLNENMRFVQGGDTFNTFDQVLASFKGKTVLIDLWGTWCTPCHQELQKNAAPLKKHFENKDLTFLYIANYDTDKQSQLEKLIAFYNLEGMHINAKKELTDDILKKTGAKGFPSYILIKKDGSYELSKAGYPMRREVLIQQIEGVL